MFTKGEITITPDKYNYTYGDTVTGKVTLTVPGPIHAKQLTLSLIAEETDTATTMSFGGNHLGDDTRTMRSTTFNVSIPLDGEKEYASQDYQFQITIPAEANPAVQMQKVEHALEENGTLGAIMGVAQALAVATPMNRQVKKDWYLSAELHVPGLLNDIKNRMQINVA